MNNYNTNTNTNLPEQIDIYKGDGDGDVEPPSRMSITDTDDVIPDPQTVQPNSSYANEFHTFKAININMNNMNQGHSLDAMGQDTLGLGLGDGFVQSNAHGSHLRKKCGQGICAYAYVACLQFYGYHGIFRGRLRVQPCGWR